MEPGPTMDATPTEPPDGRAGPRSDRVESPSPPLPTDSAGDASFEQTASRLARLGTWSYDVGTATVTWSGALHRILGFDGEGPPTPAEVIGRHELEDQRVVNDAITHCVLYGRPVSLELPYVTFDDRAIWIRLVAEAARDESGAVVRVDGVFQDISSSKEELEQRRRLSDQYVSMLESLSDGFVSLDGDFTVTWANKRFLEIFGGGSSAIVGRSIWALLGGEVRRDLEDRYLDAFVARRPFTFETRYEVLDGWFEVRVFPNREGLACLVRDITAEREIRAELEFQSQMLSHIHDAVFVCDLDERIVYWADSAERVYGWTRDEVLGRPVEDVVNPGPEVNRQVRRGVVHDGRWSGEYVVKRKDGQEVVIDGSVVLVSDERGALLGVVAVDRDVTERRQLEDRLLRSQRLESIGTMAGGLAHNLNNTLAPIVMAAELLRELDDEPAQRDELLDAIEQGAHRGSRIVHQMLTFARGTGGQRRLIDVADVVREVAELTRNTIPRSIAVEVALVDRPLIVLADPTELHQVLLNLCVNARDAMPSGGTLRLEVDEVTGTADGQTATPATGPGAEGSPRSAASGSVGGPRVAIRVTDTGTGMAPQVVGRSLEPFFTTKEVGQGTGLGLPTAVSIMQAHSGSLYLESAPGEGTRVEVQLPLHDEVPEPEVDAATQLIDGSGRRVLVVDDELAVAHLACRVLEGNGYRSVSASSVPEALAILDVAEPGFDVLLTDVMMPGMDGVELLESVSRRHPSMALLAMSGVLAADEWPRARDAGARWLVAKPFRTRDLLDAIELVLGGATQATE